MGKVVNKKYIKDYTKDNLGYLTKEDLIAVARKNDVKIKTSDYKENIVAAISKRKGVDYWDIYKRHNHYAFGLHPQELELILDISKKQRKKIENTLVKVAYTKESSANWGKCCTPYYSLESLYKLDVKKLSDWKEKNKQRVATPKQLEAIEKAKITAKTCFCCNTIKQSKNEITQPMHVCINCYSKIKDYNNSITYYNFCNRTLEEISAKNRVINKNLYMHCETAGLWANNGIVSIAIVTEMGEILLDELVKGTTPVSKGAYNAHRIKEEDRMARGITVKELRDLLMQYKGRTIYVYNKDFILPFIECSLYNGKQEQEFLNNINFKCSMSLLPENIHKEYWESVHSQRLHFNIPEEFKTRTVIGALKNREFATYIAPRQLNERIEKYNKIIGETESYIIKFIKNDCKRSIKKN